jgi:probable addiction module antidote protein/putative addiction module killer protein
MEIRQTEVYFK